MKVYVAYQPILEHAILPQANQSVPRDEGVGGVLDDRLSVASPQSQANIPFSPLNMYGAVRPGGTACFLPPAVLTPRLRV